MPSDSTADASGDTSPTPDDHFLLDRALAGDGAALRRLMGRYDRLIRYTIYRRSMDRCVRDPQWLDTVASDTWSGFVRSMRTQSGTPPGSIGGYLVRIARNQTISALRRSRGEAQRPVAELADESGIAADTSDPLEEMAELEGLHAVRACLDALEGDDRALVAQLDAITDRRWKDAAQALGMKESTLRSRWQRVLERLRECMTERTDNPFAPRGSAGDI